MGKKVSGCECCGGVSDCGGTWNVPTTYKLVINGVRSPTDPRMRHENTACACCYGVQNENIDLACDSLNGTYLLRYQGIIACHRIMESISEIVGSIRLENLVTFHYWLSDPFDVNSPGDSPYNLPNISANTATSYCGDTLNVVVPRTYIWMAARQTGDGSVSNLPGYDLGIGPPSCALDVIMIPIEVITQDVIKTPRPHPTARLCYDIRHSNVLCGALYAMRIFSSAFGFYAPGGALYGTTTLFAGGSDGYLLERDCLNACYLSGMTFYRDPITKRLKTRYDTAVLAAAKCQLYDSGQYPIIDDTYITEIME